MERTMKPLRVLPLAGDPNPCVAHACTLCCHDTEMPLLPEDMERLEALGHDPGRFTVAAPSDAPETHRLANVEGRCFFLGETGCTVHEDRPVGCRLYPLVWDPDAERPTLDADCPWRAEFRVTERHRADLSRLVARLRSLKG